MIAALAVVLVLIVVNGLLAMSEMALASSRRGRLQEKADGGDANARRALELYDEPNRFLSTVQIGISLVGVLSGAFGGSVLAAPLGDRLEAWGVPAGVAEPLAFGAVVVAITYLSLVIGELVPKRLALSAPERVASLVSAPMGVLSRLAAPLVTLLSWSTEAILRPFGIGGRRGGEPSVDEISSMLEQSRRVGHIGHAEVEMIENVFDLEERSVRSMVTPRREVHWLDADQPWEELRQELVDAAHSRLPVAHGELDRLVGVVHVHELLDRILTDQPIDIVAMAHEPLIVPESLSAVTLLERFREAGTRFALVLDEYGGVEGVVTAGDVLAALLGELASGTDEAVPSVRRLGDDRFELEGKLYVEELKDLLEVAELPREEDRDYRTLGGLVTMLAGRIPEVGDSVVAAGWRFEVTALDGPRVDRVRVEPAGQPSEAEVRPAAQPVREGPLDAADAAPDAAANDADGAQADGSDEDEDWPRIR